MRRLLAALWLALVPAACGTTMPALAQHDHARHHGEYRNWSSGKVGNCCNDDDCGTVRDDELRQSPSGTEIRIAGEWCPVLREHFLTSGKSPDWQSAHACVGKTEYWLSRPPCERLLCFVGTGGL